MNFAATSVYNTEDGRLLQHEPIIKHISKLSLRPDDEVLDVGCGTGNETKFIAEQVKGVTGIDRSEEMIATARTNNSAPNVTYAVWDAQTVGDNPEWREKFDKVVSFFVLHWVPDQPKALRSILTCLKPGGEALLITVNQDVCFKGAMKFLRSHPRWCGYLKEYVPILPWNRSVEETKDVFHQCGWTNVCPELHPHGQYQENAIKQFFRAVFGQTANIPEGDQDAYLDDLWLWLLSSYEDKSQVGLVQFPGQMIVIKASKPETTSEAKV